MSEVPFTKITPAPVNYSEEKEIYGTLYPSVNENHGGLTPIMSINMYIQCPLEELWVHGILSLKGKSVEMTELLMLQEWATLFQLSNNIPTL